ncbi:unnamed protein product [Diplocarpon coronariae]
MTSIAESTEDPHKTADLRHSNSSLQVPASARGFMSHSMSVTASPRGIEHASKRSCPDGWDVMAYDNDFVLLSAEEAHVPVQEVSVHGAEFAVDLDAMIEYGKDQEFLRDFPWSAEPRFVPATHVKSLYSRTCKTNHAYKFVIQPQTHIAPRTVKMCSDAMWTPVDPQVAA